MLLLVKNSPVKKGSVRPCDLMMQQPVLLSSKFCTKSMAHFHIVTVIRHSNMRN
jgi:hypothetical protein